MKPNKYWCGGCEQEKDRGQFHNEFRSDRPREVTTLCRECRSKAYFKKRYPERCQQCLQHRPLNKNHACAKCNEERAMRQCSKCEELLPVLLEFTGSRKCCNQCRRKLRRN